MNTGQLKLIVTPVVLQPSGGSMVASVTCDRCAETDDWRITRIPPPDILKKHFIVRGWELRKRPLCPACIKAEKGKKVTKPTLVSSTKADSQPSEAAKKAKRMVYMALEDYYDESKRRYRPGYDDAKIAAETGASEALVRQIREQDFGPLAPPSEFDALISEVREFRAEVTNQIAAWTARDAELVAKLGRIAATNGWTIGL